MIELDKSQRNYRIDITKEAIEECKAFGEIKDLSVHIYGNTFIDNTANEAIVISYKNTAMYHGKPYAILYEVDFTPATYKVKFPEQVYLKRVNFLNDAISEMIKAFLNNAIRNLDVIDIQ